MGQMSFCRSEDIIDGRYVLRAKERNPEDETYLSVYTVPHQTIINFNNNPQIFLNPAKRLREEAENTSGKYIAINCSNMQRAQRLVNQSAYFLTYLPFDRFDRTIKKYVFDNVFNRKVYHIKNFLINEYFATISDGYSEIDLFSADDFVLHWVNARKNERTVAHQEKCLGVDDLGTSIYYYFPSLDNLLCPSSL